MASFFLCHEYPSEVVEQAIQHVNISHETALWASQPVGLNAQSKQPPREEQLEVQMGELQKTKYFKVT